MLISIKLMAVSAALFTATAATAHLHHQTGGSHGVPSAANSSAQGQISLTTQLDRTRLWRDGDRQWRCQVQISSQHEPSGDRRPTDLIVVLDRSGSMGGDKIQHAKRALHELLKEMRHGDRLSLITFSSDHQVLLHQAAYQSRNRNTWHALINGIAADGGTNMGGGLQNGLSLAEQARASGRDAHLVVLSDGEVNEGMSHGELIRQASRAVPGEFVLSAVGLGEQFNEELMCRLADVGTGSYHFVRSACDLGKLFVHEFERARQRVARGMRLLLTPPAGVRVISAGGLPMTTDGEGTVVNLGALHAGQQRQLWLTYAATNLDEQKQLETGRICLRYCENERERRLVAPALPKLTVFAQQDEALAGLNRRLWSNAVLNEGWGAMQEQMATAVRRGDQQAAKQTLAAFRRQVSAANKVVGSVEIEVKLMELDNADAELEACFSGKEQQAKRNIYSKVTQSAAVQLRRTP